MNNLIEKEELNIENMIYEIRGVQVILDKDIAILYQTEAKRINEVVKRNINRFPNSFCFRINKKEYHKVLRSQIATLEPKQGKYSKYQPCAFTEHGILMLSGLLKSDIAIDMNVRIIETFVKMRKYISTSLIEQKHINELVIKDNKRIDLLEETFTKFKTKNNEIFFDGQIYDAYSKIIDILNESINEVIIIDNYLDKNMLDIISKCHNKVILITADKLDNIDLTKYNKQYSNLEIIINKSFHDRFIILDNKILYHLGASLNSLGKKCFAITKVEDEIVLKQLLKRIYF